MNIPVKVIDSRTQKAYTGSLTTPLALGKPARVRLPDGKHELYIVDLKRFLYVGNRYYLVDKNGIKFTLIDLDNAA